LRAAAHSASFVIDTSQLRIGSYPRAFHSASRSEPDGDGAWYKGRFDWNSGKDPKIWPPCQPGLPALYAKCDAATKRASSCIVPKSMRVWNGNGTCVNHALCGDYYCKDKVQATRAPFV
jgi:hypothetical protein